jgi:hypothetical protein
MSIRLRLKTPWYVRLAELRDFGRLVCALERAPLPAFSFRFGDSDIYAVQLDIIDGRPVIYYAVTDKPAGHYLAYRVSNGIEEVFPSDGVVNPTYVYSPLLHIDKLPPILTKTMRQTKGKKKESSGYVSVKLKDLASLAKVAAYKTLYEEPPLPLFYFNDGTSHALGAAMSMSENDSISYFYYADINGESKEPFLRYSSQKAEQPTFSSRLDEHGYIYLKVIHLAGDHPLVKLYG